VPGGAVASTFGEDQPAARDDRVLRQTRVLAATVIPALLAGSTILFVFPAHTGTLFAWEIKAHMSGAALAVPYIAGAYFFARVLTGSRWHHFAAGLLPVAAFTWAQGIATVLHWGLFNHDHVAFWAWALIYLTTPLLVPLVWWRNQARDPGTPDADDVEIPRAAHIGFALAGVGQLAIALFLVLFPSTAIDIWPWHLTPLTARTTAGWFAFGLFFLLLVRETRWSAARITFQALLLGLVLALVSIVRYWEEFHTERVTTWVFVVGLVTLTAMMALLYAVMERRRGTGFSATSTT
jgi:hypothetical protein